MENIKITNFCLKQFVKGSSGTKILDHTPIEFEEILNHELKCEGDNIIYDGYAPFCKLIIIKNFTNAKTGTLPIDVSNHQYLRGGYFSRREFELPVFSRWLELPVPAPMAEYLVIVLYDKNQIEKEALSEYNRILVEGGIESVGLEKPAPFEGDWGIIAILAQMSSCEEPMKPETMLRNYMPLEYGGSGMKIPEKPTEPNHFDFDNEESYKIAMKSYNQKIIEYKDERDSFFRVYQNSVDFWQVNTTVK